jgi:hypothetical protein
MPDRVGVVVMKTCRYAVALATLACPTNAYGGDVDPAWLTRLTTEGRAAYGKYAAVSNTLEEVAETRATADGPIDKNSIIGTFANHTRSEKLCRLGPHILCHEMTRVYDDKPGGPPTRLRCLNASYEFTLAKEKPDSPYVLIGTRPAEQSELSTYGFGVKEGPIHLFNDALRAAGGEENYSLEQVRWDSRKNALYIRFSRPARYPPPAASKIVRDELWVEPDHSWRVVERKVDTPHLIATESYRYGTEIDGCWFMSESSHVAHYKAKGLPPIRDTCRVLSLRKTEKTPADFTLSAFGFPEPEGVVPAGPPPRRLWPWLLVAAPVAFAALALWFRRLARRRPAAQGG